LKDRTLMVNLMDLKKHRMMSEMRNRIRNILIEALILESPLFKAVAVKYNGKVYRGKPGDYHEDVQRQIVIPLILDPSGIDFDEDWSDEIYDRIRDLGIIDGYITNNGRFVSKEDALKMITNPDSDFPDDSVVLRQTGDLVDA
jgi:hypothetical protein